MHAPRDNRWMLREGLFAKYVVSMVGLVVFVLTVNGALETWITYRGTRTTLTEALFEKAQAVTARIEQQVTELERQISWVTRASSKSLEDRRADYAQLLGQAAFVTQLSQLDGYGHEQLRLSRHSVTYGSNADLSRDARFTEGLARGVSFAPAYFAGNQPMMSISVAHSGFNAGVTVAEIDLRFLSDFLSDAQLGKAAFAYIVDPAGRVLASSSHGPEIASKLASLPQVAAGLAPGGLMPTVGTDFSGQPVLTAAAVVPRLNWRVFFEQPAAQALTPIRDQLMRVALLIGMGLIVATLAGTLLARRMLIPIQALRAGARRLGAGDFAHRIGVNTSDELQELAEQFNGMAAQLQQTYAGLEAKVEERTRDLAQSINELKAIEEVGRALASSLELEAVLPTIATHAIAITHADAVLIYGYEAEESTFNLLQANGMAQPVGPRQLSMAQEARLLGSAASSGEPVAIDDLARAPDTPLREAAADAGFRSMLVVPLVDQQGTLGALVILRRGTGEFTGSLIGSMRTFAHQAVLAMRNARLFSEVNQKGRELAAAHQTVQRQAEKLKEQTEQLRQWNRSLEERVEKQLAEIERIRRLERFLAPQVAQLIASSDGQDALLQSHRREVTVVFCDLRGFTAFTEAAEPEEAMHVLREYHAALGRLIFKYEGTLDRYAGDGVMVLFNAPIKLEDHTARAVKMAVEMRDTIGLLAEKWKDRGHSLGFGIGIALGYATLGQVGFEHRLEYAAIGSVTNLASRLCAEARAGQIVVSRRVYGMVAPHVEARPLDDLHLKGFNHPILAMEILRWHEDAAPGSAISPSATAASTAEAGGRT